MGSSASKTQQETFLRHCYEGNLEPLMEMLEGNGVKHFLNTTHDGNKMYGVHLGAERGHTQIVELLLKHGADPSLQTVRGNTALHIAARSGMTEPLRVILRTLSDEVWQRTRLLWIAHKKPSDGQTLPWLPLDMTRLVSFYIMRDCLNTNKLVAITNHDGLSALELGMKNRHEDVVKLLLNRTSANTIRDSHLGSPLHAAAAFGMGEACRFVCRTTRDVNALNRRGETPLFRACCAYPEAETTVECLLSLGADPTITAHDGRSPLEEAEARKYHRSAKLIREFLKPKK